MSNLKQIAIATLCFVGVFIGGITLYIYFSDNSTEKKDDLSLIDGTKFPLSVYTHIEPKKQEEKKNALEIVEEIKKNTQPPEENKKLSYTEEIFSSFKEDENEKRGKELEEARRRVLSNQQHSDLESGIFIQEEIAPVIDYGDNQFDNLKTKVSVSHQTKLYRAILASSVIPAVLEDGISSNIAGQVVAQVESDVFASMGSVVLIPKGSKAIGYYESNNKIGEYRLNVVWTRIITPLGINIVLPDSMGADISGKNGLIGLLDNKYWERYGIPLTLSTLSNALLIGISNLTAKVPNYQTQVLFEQAGSDLSVIMQNIMRDQIKINPTLEILAGSRILIKTRSDIWFPEPKANENGVLEIITQQLQNKEEVMHNQKQSQHTRSKK